MTAPKPPLTMYCHGSNCDFSYVLLTGAWTVAKCPKCGSSHFANMPPLSGAAPAPQIHLFYRLWDKAVGKDGYNKAEWQTLERFILPPAAPVAVPAGPRHIYSYDFARLTASCSCGWTFNDCSDEFGSKAWTEHAPPAPLPPPQECRCLCHVHPELVKHLTRLGESVPCYCVIQPTCDGPCKDCGMPCLPWFAPNDIWNKVVPERSGLLCPVCFLERAFKMGIDGHWILKPEFHDEETTRTDQSATSSQSESQNAESVFSKEPLASSPERKKDSSEVGETRTEAQTVTGRALRDIAYWLKWFEDAWRSEMDVSKRLHARIAQLERELRKFHADECRCFWCYELFPFPRKATVIEQAAALTAHAMECDKNPISKLRAALTQAQAQKSALMEAAKPFAECVKPEWTLKEEVKKIRAAMENLARVYEQVKEKI